MAAPENLNTEENDIAGNPLTGPANNSAARPGPAVGQPAGDPRFDPNLPGTPHPLPQGNDYVSPVGANDDLSDERKILAAEAHRDNQAADPDRGDFGKKGHLGGTHKGFGDQARAADYDHPAPAPTAQASPPRATTPVLNDNGAANAPQAAYAPDYGHTSTTHGLPDVPPPAAKSQLTAGPRGTADPTAAANPVPQAPTADPLGGRHEVADPLTPETDDHQPEPRTEGNESGYTGSAQGDVSQGLGSKGGSYNDPV